MVFPAKALSEVPIVDYFLTYYVSADLEALELYREPLRHGRRCPT